MTTSNLTLLIEAAVNYARVGIEVFPLHPFDCRCVRFDGLGCGNIPKSRGKVPLTMHGVLDASNDEAQVRAWWQRWSNANIGIRPAENIIVLDIDPRAGGDITWNQLVTDHGPAPTRVAHSGRNDGGHHRYYQHPGGELRGKVDSGTGIDIKARGGYVVAPPSIHAATGLPYRWESVATPAASLPDWLVPLVRKPEPAKPPTPAQRFTPNGLPIRELPQHHRRRGGVLLRDIDESIAQWFTDNYTWAQILKPHRWVLLKGKNGDEDGSRWQHPTATSSFSATIKHGCLFVYSPNTDFGVTAASSPRGYTRFAAYAQLNHRGDLSAAARAARAIKESQ